MAETISFAEASINYEKGFLIESAETGRTFFKDWAKDADDEIRASQSFDPDEIRGLWLKEPTIPDDTSLYDFLVAYITRNYDDITENQVEATARGIEYYLTETVIPETLENNKDE